MYERNVEKNIRKCSIALTDNPYKGKVSDSMVKSKLSMKNQYDPLGERMGLPDKFTLEVVREYLWNEGNILLQEVSTNIYSIVYSIA